MRKDLRNNADELLDTVEAVRRSPLTIRKTKRLRLAKLMA
jgi:hypothetical protein